MGNDRFTRLVRFGVAAALGVAFVVGGAAVASAHGGAGDIEIGQPEQVGPLTVEFPIRVTYQNDGHDAEAIEDVAVTGVGEDGTTFGPIDPFEPGDAPGVWIATVELPGPGGWDLTIVIGEPESSAAVLVEVSEPDEPAPDAPTDDTVEVETGDDPADATDAVDDGVADDGEDASVIGEAADDGDGDDGGALPVIVVLVAFMLAAVAGIVGYRNYQAKAGATTEE
jgi:hypothetical protein